MGHGKVEQGNVLMLAERGVGWGFRQLIYLQRTVGFEGAKWLRMKRMRVVTRKDKGHTRVRGARQIRILRCVGTPEACSEHSNRDTIQHPTVLTVVDGCGPSHPPSVQVLEIYLERHGYGNRSTEPSRRVGTGAVRIPKCEGHKSPSRPPSERHS